MAYLVLVRHGLTGWNKEGRWQGITDTPLSMQGKKQIQSEAFLLKDISFDVAFASNLLRTQETLNQLKIALNLNCPIYHEAALNERDYGIYTGKNKWEVEKEIGDDQFKKLRREFNYPVPAGETLKNVYERVTPFYQENILPLLKNGKNILLVSSGNTLRALIKYLEHISDQAIADLELGFGAVIVYKVDSQGQILEKEIRQKTE